jgi:pyrroline-5-carboxylate reductase
MGKSEAKIGIIGAGNMGGAIARGILSAGLYDAHDVLICDVIPRKAEELAREAGIRTADTPDALAASSSAIIIAVKPQTMAQCLDEIKEAVDSSKLIISIAAGITTEFIEQRLDRPDGGARVVRVMPNTPALVGEGAAAICGGSNAGEADLEIAEKIFAALGKAYRLDESLIDAVTAVSGSGPAYLFLFAESLERAAVEAGLPEDMAAGLVAQTLFGSAKLLIGSSDTASELREKVTSPGGTTEAALAVFRERNFEDIITAAVMAALARGRELGGVKET